MNDNQVEHMNKSDALGSAKAFPFLELILILIAAALVFAVTWHVDYSSWSALSTWVLVAHLVPAAFVYCSLRVMLNRRLCRMYNSLFPVGEHLLYLGAAVVLCTGVVLAVLTVGP